MSVNVGYGIGYYYKAVKDNIKEMMHIDYLCDKKWDDSDIIEYDGIPVIKREQLATMPDIQVIIFSCNDPVRKQLSAEFKSKGISYKFASDIMGAIRLTGTDIKRRGVEGSLRIGTNSIRYDESLPDDIVITLSGMNATIEIGKNLIIDKFSINAGNNCEVCIGNDVRVIIADVQVAYAKFTIGNDCLIASNVSFRTHDSHFIFDKTTRERINRAKDVEVGDQVWIAAGAKLLGGAKIGTGSVVGANAVTSSQFPPHVIIAGVPAKVIRENIIWSKDNTQYADFDYFDECVSQDALKYL